MIASRSPRRRSSPSTAKAPARPVGRPRSISDACILEAARTVFLDRGIRATTADVARRANVAEGTLFHRFDSKDALFRAAMRFDPEDVPRMLEALPSPSTSEEMRSVLGDAAMQLLRHARVALPVMMMSWSNSSGEYALARLPERADPVRRARKALTAFFRAQMSAGRLAARSPEVLARVFLGSIHHYCFSEIVGIDNPKSRVKASTFVRELVDLLTGAPTPAAPRGRRGAPPPKPRAKRTRSRR